MNQKIGLLPVLYFQVLELTLMSCILGSSRILGLFDDLLTFEQPVAAVTAGLTASAGDHRQGQLQQLSPPASDPAKMTQAAGRQLSLHINSHTEPLMGHLKPCHCLLLRC